MSETSTPTDTTAADEFAGWAEGGDDVVDVQADDVEQTAADDASTETGAATDDNADPNASDDDDSQAADTSDSTVPADDDLWSAATSAQRTAYEQLASRHKDLEHKVKSFEGRVPGLQRENDELKRRLQELEQTGSKPDNAEDDKGSNTLDFGEDWELLKQDYPSVAAALEKQLAAQTQQNPPAPVQALGWDQAMDAVRPGWRDDIESDPAKTAAFQSWLKSQPEAVQTIALQPEAWAAIEVYDLYKSHLDGKKKHADEISTSRKNRLKNAESEKGKASQAPAEGDPNAGWAA